MKKIILSLFGSFLVLGLSSPVDAQTRTLSNYRNLRTTCQGQLLNYGTVCQHFTDNGYPMWYSIDTRDYLISIVTRENEMLWAVGWLDSLGEVTTVDISFDYEGNLLRGADVSLNVLQYFTEDFEYIGNVIRREGY